VAISASNPGSSAVNAVRSPAAPATSIAEQRSPSFRAPTERADDLSLWRRLARPRLRFAQDILDLCADPALGGGIQHVMHCLRTYLKRNDRDIERLLGYGRRLSIPTGFKRLGFL
jgi:hypothetical protein